MDFTDIIIEAGGKLARTVEIFGNEISVFDINGHEVLAKEPQLSESLADEAKRYFQDKIFLNLGSRKIPEGELNELTAYWTAMVFGGEYAGISTGSVSAEFVEDERMRTKEELRGIIIKYLQNEFKSGSLGMYEQYAGNELRKVIEHKINRINDIEILDVGYADAKYLLELKEIFGDKVNVYGISNRIDKNSGKINYNLGLAEVLPEEWNDKFDLITVFESSKYFFNKLRAFKEALRVLKNGGNLFYEFGTKVPLSNGVLINKLAGSESDAFDSEDRWYSHEIDFFKYLTKITRDGLFREQNNTFEIVDRNDLIIKNRMEEGAHENREILSIRRVN